jgi:hypothetical protein
MFNQLPLLQRKLQKFAVYASVERCAFALPVDLWTSIFNPLFTLSNDRPHNSKSSAMFLGREE